MVGNTELTVYNKTTDKRTRNEILFKTLVPSALFIEKEATIKSVASVGMDSSDDVKIYISKDSINRADKDFVRSKKLVDTESQFTIEKGSIVVKGSVHQDFGSVKELEKNLDSVYIVTSVTYHDYGSSELRHIEISAR